MKRRMSRDFLPVGLGNPGGPADVRGLLDMDRCMVGPVGEYMAVPGWQRVGEPVADPDMIGAAADELLVLRFDQEYIRRHEGHGLVVIDNAEMTRGRVLAIDHHPSGLKGTKLAGNPRQITGSGLDDLTVRAAFTGTISRRAVITIVGTGSPNTFDLSLDGVVVAEDVACSTTLAQVGTTGIYVSWGATTGHTSGNAWAFGTGGRMAFARAMKRLHCHHYPMMASAEGLTLISHGFDELYADDGYGVRQVGIPRPHLPPTVATEVVETSGGDGIDQLFNATADFGTGAGQWQTVAGSGVTVSRETATPDPPEGASYMQLRVPQRHADGGQDLAFVNLAAPNTPWTIPANTTVVRVRLYLDEEDWIRNRMSNGALALVFAESAALADERVVVNLEGEFAGKRWYDVEAPWTRQTDFAIRSIGIRLDKALQSHMDLGSGDVGILIDQLLIDSGADDAVVGSDLFAQGSGDWRACFTYYDRARRIEGPPSPASQPFTGNDGAMRLDVSGWYPGIQAGLQNATAQRGVDAVHIYLNNANWPADEQTGGRQWRRATPTDGLLIEDLEKGAVPSVVGSTGTGNGTLDGIYIRRGCPAGHVTVTFSSATAFSLTFDGASDETPTSGTVGTPFQNQYFGFTAVAGGTAWVNTDTRYFDISDTELHANDRLLATISTPTDEALLLTAPLAPWFNWRLPNGEILASIGRRVLVAGRPGVEFDAGLTNGSSLVTGIDANLLGDWMEGRVFRVDEDDSEYVVLKAIDTDADGDLDALWIVQEPARDRSNQDAGEPAGGYTGTTGTKRCRILSENDRLWWSNVTARGQRQVDVTTASPLNQFDIPGSAFSIGGVAVVGQFAWLIDSFGKGAYVFLHNQNARDDVEPGAAFTGPIVQPGVSCASKRAVVSLPDGRAVWLGQKGEIFVASQSNYVRHPLSDQMMGLVAGRGLVLGAIGLRHAWGLAIGGSKVVWGLRASPDYAGVNPNGEPGVVALAPAPRTFRSALLPYNWPPTDAELGDADRDESEAWAEDVPIYGQMHLIPGFIGWNEWNGETGSSLWNADELIFEPYTALIVWTDVNANGYADSYFSKAAYVSAVYAMFTIGDVSGLKSPSQNGFYSGPTTNRALPSTPPTPYTDLESHWDDRDPVITKVTDGIWTRLAASVPSVANLTNWNGVNVIHGWGSYGSVGVDLPMIGDGAGSIFTHPCMVLPGIRLVTAAQWTSTPAAPVPIAQVRINSSPTPLQPRQDQYARLIDCEATAIRFKVWAEAYLQTGQIPAGTFQLRFRNLSTVPDDIEASEHPAEHPSDRVVPIDVAFDMNAFTAVTLTDLPARNGRYRDRDGRMRDCIYYTHIILEQVLAIASDRFQATNADLHLFFTQGHQVVAQGTGTTLPPVLCDDQGSTDQDEVEGEFEFGVEVDIDAQTLSPMSNLPITAVASARNLSCGEDGMLVGAPIGGDAHGFIARLFEERSTAWGRPAILTKLRAGPLIADTDPAVAGTGLPTVLRMRNAAAQRAYLLIVNDDAGSWDLSWTDAGEQPNRAFGTTIAGTPLVARLDQGSTLFAASDNWSMAVADYAPFAMSQNAVYAIRLADSGASSFFVDLDGPPLPTDPEDNGMLAGLVALRTWADADGEYRRWESRRIVANTDLGLQIAGAWTRDVAAGDKLIVAPIVSMFHLPEVETAFPAALRSIAFNFDDQSHHDVGAGPVPTLFRLEVFEGPGRAIRGDHRTAAATKFFNSNDLLTRREIGVPRHASKARSYRLTVIGRETGPVSVRNLILNEAVHAGERGK